ncbi:MAG: hypothetical protein L0241_23255 [Planctomycetia bacterium]|nr:hypothetical protein [Planctomycetia bacterium]
MFRYTILAVAVVALGLCAGQVTAQEPKAQKLDLSELRDAVTAADKRGENVADILTALAALEKAMAKGIKPAQPGEMATAPPELVTLREAVEMATKKGENVEAIAKELALVEKAITGREYQRPKPPSPPQPEPLRPFPPGRGNPGIVIGGNGGGIVIGNSGMGAMSITISGGNFTIKAKQGDVTYSVTGSIADPDVLKIVIQDGEKKIEAEELKKVPEKYRPAVERLLKSITRR